PGKLIRNRDMLIQFSPEWADRVTGFCPELGTIRPLYEDAVYGVEFRGATAMAGQRLLAQIGATHGAERIVLFLQLMIALARNPADRRRLSRLAPTAAQVELPPELDVAMRYVLEHYS